MRCSSAGDLRSGSVMALVGDEPAAQRPVGAPIGDTHLMLAHDFCECSLLSETGRAPVAVPVIEIQRTSVAQMLVREHIVEALVRPLIEVAFNIHHPKPGPIQT